MKKKILTTFLVLFISALLVSPALAQRLTGSLSGKIVDKSNEALPGCNLTLASPALLGTKNYVCTAGGKFRFPALPPGTYSLSADMPSYQKLTLEGIIINVGKSTVINVSLEVSPIQEEITVIGEAPMIDARSTKIAVSYSKDLLENIPMERNISEVLAATPGAVNVGEGGQSNIGSVSVVGGTHHAATRFAMDGVDMTDPAVGGPNTNISFDLFEEVELGLGAHPADVGHVPGAYINIVTRSGGNEFHGQALAYYYNDNFVSQNFSEEQLDTLGLASPPMDKSMQDFSIILGGPIVKDKLWFFLSGRSLDSASLMTDFPKDITHKEYFGFGKMTFQIRPNIKLVGFVNYMNAKDPIAQASPQEVFESTAAWDQESWTFNSQINWILSQNAFIDIRAMWNDRVLEKLQQEGATHRNTDLGTGMNSGSMRFPEFTKRGRFQFYPSLTLFIDDFLGGSHEFKIGGEYERSWTTNEVWHTDPMSSWTLNGSPYIYGGNEGRFRAWGYGPERGDGEKYYKAWRYSGYIQDHWTIKDRLTLNLGLRYFWTTGGVPAQYYEEVPTWQFLDPVFFGRKEYDDATDLVALSGFAPRLGLSYDVLGNGKTLFKASFSRYYDYILMTYIAALRTQNWQQYLWTDDNLNGEVDAGDTFRLQAWFGRPSEDPHNQYDPNLKPPAWNELIVGLDQELLPDLKVGVNFIYRHQLRMFYKEEKDNLQNWATPLTVTDPGYDGEFGTSDDAQITIFDRTNPFEKWFYTNPPNAFRKYRGVELIMEKRMSNKWQLLFSIVYSKMWGTIGGQYNTVQGQGSHFDTPNYMINREGRSDYDRPLVIKLQGTYQAPYGINLSASFVGSSGAPFTRSVRIFAPNQGSYIEVNAEPQGSRRNPAWNRLDLRVEKEFLFGDVGRLGFYIDVYNALNVASVFTYSNRHGDIRADGTFAQFGRWQTISSVSLPQVIKLGARFRF